MSEENQKRIHKLLERLLGDSEKFTLEIQNATLSIIVGIIFIINTSEIYNRFPDTYRWMEFAPAFVWGTLYFSAGVFHLICIFTGLRYLRKQILLVKSALWIFIAVCVIFADPLAFAGYFYFVFFISAFRGFLRIQILQSDDIAENVC